MSVPLPYEIGIHSCVSVGPHIYLAGTYIRDIIRLNVETHKIEKLGSYTKASGPLEVIDECVYNISGQDSEDIECFDINSVQVSCVAKLKGETCLFVSSYSQGVEYWIKSDP